jgi:predicted amidohydrolase
MPTGPVDLAVLPEYAYTCSPRLALATPRGPAALARKVSAPVVFGAVDGDYYGGTFTNLAVVIDAEAHVLGTFPKQRPVPLMRDGTQGTTRPVFPVHAGVLGVAICYDLDAPTIAAALVRGGATVLVTPTYDAMSWTATQHVHHGLLVRLRAVENDRWVLRATSSGRTEVIDPHGVPSVGGVEIGTVGSIVLPFGHRSTTPVGGQLYFLGPVFGGLAMLAMVPSVWQWAIRIRSGRIAAATLAVLALVQVGCWGSPVPTPAGPPPAAPPKPVYPAHWWAPVSKEGAPAWEIMPQEAGPGEVILSKRHELGLLSNFAATPFTYHGKTYASLEGFWQMMLYPEGPDDPRTTFAGNEWKYTRHDVARMTGFDAKAAGTLASANMKRMGIDWVSFEGRRFPYKPAEPGEHYRLIVAATLEKVRQNPEVKRVLLATGDLVLKPDHHQEPNPPAAWRYYEILTKIRTQLQGS